MTPTARTLALLRQLGYWPDVVERYLHHARRKHDFLGFADVLAVHRHELACLAIQATTRAHVSDRLARARSRPELAAWLAAGNRFECWGWHRLASGRWDCVRVAVQARDLAGIVLCAPRSRRRRKGERQMELFAEL